MKKRFFTSKLAKTSLALVLFSGAINAQTNTFPTTGNVGIGTTSPTTKLQINGGHVGTTLLMHSEGNKTKQSEADLFMWSSEPQATWTGVGLSNNINPYNSATNKPFVLFTPERGGSYFRLLDNSFTFNTVSSNAVDKRMFEVNTAGNVLFPNGNVGIGTSNPTEKLDVVGNAKISQVLEVGGPDFILGTNDGRSKGTKTAQRAMIHSSKDELILNYDGDFEGGTVIHGPKLEIHGNVGIGTATPTAKLEVSETIAKDQATNGSFRIVNRSDATIERGLRMGATNTYSWMQSFGTIPLYINPIGHNVITNLNGGNLGIGTVTPTEKLHVNGNITTGNTSGLTGAVFLGNNSHGLKRINNDVVLYTHGADGNLIFTNMLDKERMRVDANGKVGIGTSAPDEMLTVKGNIHAREVRVDLKGPLADYVFQKYYTGNSNLKSDYKMPTLSEVEAFTKENHRLPNVPSAQEIQENGLKLGEMNNILLQKIEELTLYIIEQQKQIDDLKKDKYAK